MQVHTSRSAFVNILGVLSKDILVFVHTYFLNLPIKFCYNTENIYSIATMFLLWKLNMF
jgi:hypothetical protein